MKKAYPRILAALLAAFSLLLSCKPEPSVEPEPEPGPGPEPVEEYENLRAYKEESEDVSLSMPETTVYIKDEVADDLQSLDPDWNSITFSNSDVLKYQNIKEGDILYSAERTVIAPNGYCLRVLGITESGGTVTYKTEPASVLDAFDHLKEKNIFSFGNYKPEDINVYFTEVDADQMPQTRADDDSRGEVELKGDKYEFKSDGKSTSFKVDVWEDKDHGDIFEGKLKLTLGITVQHEILNDMETESYFSADEGNFVLFCMAKIGVGVTVEFGTTFKLYDSPISPDSPDYEYWKTVTDLAKASLIGKRFKLLDVPLNYTATKVLIDPRFVVYGEFKLDVSGKLVIETGIKDAVYAINIANDGYSLKWKEGWSYVKKITNFRPYFDVTATAKLQASIGSGLGFNFELPGLPIVEKDHIMPSAVGVWFGYELSQTVDITLKGNLLAGETEVIAEGKDGKVTCEASVSGVIGIRKAKLNIDWRAWPKEGEVELVTIPGWEKKWTISNPTPYGLQSEVNGDSVLLSWKHPDSYVIGTDTRIYIGYAVAGDVANAYKTNYPGTELIYGPAIDGHYRWKVENKTPDGGIYTSPTESFEINNSTITTGTPVLKGDVWEIPVTLNTLNEVKSKGVVYSSQYSDPSPDTEDCVEYEGEESSFTVSISDLLSGLKYYARSYAYIQKNGGWFKIYGDVVTLSIEPPKMTMEPSALDFGNVVMGETAVLPISFTNDGGLDLVISSITCAEGFSTPLAEGDKFVVKPGETRELSVTFAPTENRPYGGTMIINSNASGSQTAVVKLSGNGVTPAVPQIVVDPYSIVFDPVVEGSGQSSDIPITITNIGDALLTISSIELSETETPFEIIGDKPQTLDKDAEAQISIRFDPAVPGTFTNTLVIKSDASNSPELSIPISGECTPALKAAISVSPQIIDFGEIMMGESVTEKLTIRNVGGAPLMVSSIVCPNGFDLFEPLSDNVIEPGGSRYVRVLFKAVSVGAYSGNLTIVSDDEQQPEVTVALSATCKLPPVPAGNIVFEDSNVKSICVANWDTNKDGALSYAEAAAVTDLGETFANNTKIKTFNELKYFIGLSTIGKWAFADCKALTRASLPPTVKTLGQEAFAGSGLESIDLAEGLESIGRLSFSFCEKLKTVAFPSTVKELDYESFAYSGIERVTIPGTLKKIGAGAFLDCYSLGSITLQQGVETIGENAFGSNAVEYIKIPSSVKKISMYAFYGSKLKTVEFEDGLKYLEEGVFSDCSQLVNVKLPSTLRTIERYAFKWCTSLQKITVPEEVYSIWADAFFSCTCLAQVVLGNPDRVVSVYSYSFPWNNSGFKVYVPDSLLDEYKATSIWSDHTDCLRPMSDL